MSMFVIRLSDRVIKLWISRAERNLKEKGMKDNFQNIISEIKNFDNHWIIMGLSEQDIKDIHNIYNKIQLQRRMIKNEF